MDPDRPDRQAVLRIAGYSRGVEKIWADRSATSTWTEAVYTFGSPDGARSFFATSEDLDDGSKLNAGSFPLGAGVPAHYGYGVLGKVDGRSQALAVALKGNVVVSVGAAGVPGDLNAAVAAQITREYAALPPSTVEPGVSGLFGLPNLSQAQWKLVDVGFILVFIVTIALALLSRRRPHRRGVTAWPQAPTKRQPAMSYVPPAAQVTPGAYAPSGIYTPPGLYAPPQSHAVLAPHAAAAPGPPAVFASSSQFRMSPDRGWWWDGKKWQDADKKIPPGATVSSDGRSWFDGVGWRPLPRGR